MCIRKKKEEENLNDHIRIDRNYRRTLTPIQQLRLTLVEINDRIFHPEVFLYPYQRNPDKNKER